MSREADVLRRWEDRGEDEMSTPGLRLLSVATKYRVLAEKHFEERKVRWSEVRVLVFLRRLGTNNPVPQQAIADECELNKATVVRAIDRLEKRGLVTRHGDPGDRRVNFVCLTSAGFKFSVDLLKELRKYDSEDGFGKLEDSRKEQLFSLLEKLEKNLSDKLFRR